MYIKQWEGQEVAQQEILLLYLQNPFALLGTDA